MPASPPAGLSYEDGDLRFAGASLSDVARRVATPFFLVSAARLRHNHDGLRAGLAASGLEPRLYYCAKTNNEAAVLATLAALGSRVLVSHAAEYELARRCGFAAERVALQRPLLDDGELRRMVDDGLGLLQICAPWQVEQARAAAAATGRRLAVSLRLRPPRAPWFLSPLAAANARLGLPAEAVVAAATEMAGGRHLRPAGLSLYIGTQQSAPRRFAVAVASLVDLARRLAQGGIAIEELNLGGGIPSPSQARLSLARLWPRLRGRVPAPRRAGGQEAFARALGELARAALGRARVSLPALAAEPGRAMVGSAAVLVTRVRAVEGRWVFLDCSRNHLGESSLLFPRPLLPVARRAEAGERLVHLSGATLNTLDVVDVWRRLPVLAAGDLLAVAEAGAYTIARASRYAGLAPAVHLLAEDGSVRQVRRAEGLAELSAAMVLQGGRE